MLSGDKLKQNYSTAGAPLARNPARSVASSSIPTSATSNVVTSGIATSTQAIQSSASGITSKVSNRVQQIPGRTSASMSSQAPTAVPIAPSSRKEPLTVSPTSVQRTATSAHPASSTDMSDDPYPVPQQSFLGNKTADECLDETPEQVELETLKVAKKLHIRKIIFGILSIVGLIACFIICLGCGREDIWPFTAIEVIWNHVTGMGEFSLADRIVIWDIRLPIVCAATLAGAALSVSGASYQGLFRNPLVSPDILGAAAGAAFGAAMALLLNFDNTMVELFAFVGGFIAVMITWLSASYIGNGSNQPLLLVLTGLITATLFQACVEIIKYIADPYSTLPEITYWLMGSLAKVTWSNLGFFCIPFLIGMIPLLLLRWRLNALSMGDDEAKSLGINVPLMRGIFIFCATLLTAAVVSIAGIVGWVGLIIPHITRFMFGPDNRIVLPMSTVIGAIFLMIVSTICRSAIASEIPLGVLTSIVGAPLFFLILIKTRLGQTGD